MPHDDGGLATARAAVHAVHIAPADATGHDLNEHFTRTGLGLGDILNFELRRSGENEGFHGRG